jgi:ABC-type sugar transport system ATPase subunit
MSEAPARAAPLLELRGVTKRFPGVTALENVSFPLERGEVHALLGENGAGKSTLIKILAGIHVPDEGATLFEGHPVEIQSVAEANRLGIRVIHQELSLAPNLSIAENIYLGREPQTLGWIHRRRIHDEAKALVAALGLHELKDVRAIVAGLSLAHRQLVEIARALSAQARVLILDEPTSSLSQTETEALFSTLRRLRAQGVGIIYISHRLEEVLRLADRITVLRDGRSMGTQRREQVDQRALVRAMVGREIVDYFQRPARHPGPVALEVKEIWSPRIRGVSFRLHYGEVLGLAGLVGAGRSDLLRALFGLDPIDRGEILVDGRRASITSPRQALEAGIVLVPEDRKREGLVMMQSVAFNLALPWTDDWNPACLPDKRRRRAIVERAIRGFQIRAANPEQGISGLSGGHQQKALVARWMEKRPKILLLDEPTRGVDVGARKEMFGIIASLVEEGMAVLFVSSDLAEVLNMSHRIGIYRGGRIVEVANSEDFTAEGIMARLTGAEREENE